MPGVRDFNHGQQGSICQLSKGQACHKLMYKPPAACTVGGNSCTQLGLALVKVPGAGADDQEKPWSKGS